jgi:hypothetical protein
MSRFKWLLAGRTWTPFSAVLFQSFCACGTAPASFFFGQGSGEHCRFERVKLGFDFFDVRFMGVAVFSFGGLSVRQNLVAR